MNRMAEMMASGCGCSSVAATGDHPPRQAPPFLMLRLSGHSFDHTLRGKLGWGTLLIAENQPVDRS
jgi:hypothetical protein